MSDFSLLAQAQLANEMLVRGAILGGGSKWMGVYLTTVQRVPESTSNAIAGWLTLALGTSVVVLRQYKMFTEPPVLTTAKVEKDKITGKLKAKDMDAETLKAEMNNDVEKVKQFKKRLERTKATHKFMLTVDGSRTVVDWVLVGGVFVYSGNLLGPLCGCVCLDVVYSGLQRVNLRRVRSLRAARLRDMLGAAAAAAAADPGCVLCSSACLPSPWGGV